MSGTAPLWPVLGRFSDNRGPARGWSNCTFGGMRFRRARVLSVGAVLATALAVTTYGHVIGSASVAASASSSSSPSSSPSTGSTPGSTPASVAVSAPAPVVVTVGGTPVPGSATQFAYLAGDAATVILDSAGGTLRVVTFAPHPGWFTVRLDQPSPTGLEVRLESASGQVRFSASVVEGSVVTELELGVPGGSVPAASVPGASTPDGSAPGNSGPDNSGPDNTGPDNTGPDNSSPNNTAPGDDGGGGGDDGDDDNSGPGGGNN